MIRALLLPFTINSFYTYYAPNYNVGYGNQNNSAKNQIDIQKMLNLVNKEERGKSGCNQLKLDDKLMQKAESHSRYQANIRTMTHNGPYGAKGGNALDSYGLAENVAYNTGDERAVMIAWVKSQGHYKNMVNPKYKYFGAAVYEGYWTQEFA